MIVLLLALLAAPIPPGIRNLGLRIDMYERGEWPNEQ